MQAQTFILCNSLNKFVINFEPINTVGVRTSPVRKRFSLKFYDFCSPRSGPVLVEIACSLQYGGVGLHFKGSFKPIFEFTGRLDLFFIIKNVFLNL